MSSVSHSLVSHTRALCLCTHTHTTLTQRSASFQISLGKPQHGANDNWQFLLLWWVRMGESLCLSALANHQKDFPSSDCKYVSCQVLSTEFFKLHVCHWKLNAMYAELFTELRVLLDKCPFISKKFPPYKRTHPKYPHSPLPSFILFF